MKNLHFHVYCYQMCYLLSVGAVLLSLDKGIHDRNPKSASYIKRHAVFRSSSKTFITKISALLYILPAFPQGQTVLSEYVRPLSCLYSAFRLRAPFSNFVSLFTWIPLPYSFFFALFRRNILISLEIPVNECFFIR